MAASLEKNFFKIVTSELHTDLVVPGQKGNKAFFFDFQK